MEIKEIPEHPLYRELWEGTLEASTGLPGEGLAYKNPWQFLALNDIIYNDLFNEYISTRDKSEKIRLGAEMAGLAASAEAVKLGLEGFS